MNTSVTQHTPNEVTAETCAHFPELLRMNYFHGQLLNARDFLAEQAYLRNKSRLLNRCLYGYGVVCGLEICPVPVEEECPPKYEEKCRRLQEEIEVTEKEIEELKKKAAAGDESAGAELKERQATFEKLKREYESCCKGKEVRDRKLLGKVLVNCGLALDCEGRELVVHRPLVADLDSLLKPSLRKDIAKGTVPRVYLSICYLECGVEPTRPMALDQCGLTAGCVDARIRETVRLELSREEPNEDQRCEFCCTPCDESCVLLAKIELHPGQPIEEGDIDNSVRRRFGLYEPTVITEISWEHGDAYTQDEAIKVLGTDDTTGGIVVRFSRPVRAETITPGVFDLWYVTGGPGAAGSIMHKKGEYVDLPSSGLVDRVRYRDVTEETLQVGDRVIIIVRGSFILDACCQPVDAVHVGGKVPQALPPEDQNDGRNGDGNDGRNEEPYEDPNGKPDGETGKYPCAVPPGGFGPWTSGNGVPGGTFESWFYISKS